MGMIIPDVSRQKFIGWRSMRMLTSVTFGLQWGARADHAIVANDSTFCAGFN